MEATGDGDGPVSWLEDSFCFLEVSDLEEAATLFLDKALPQVFTILKQQIERAEKNNGGLGLERKRIGLRFGNKVV